MKSLQQLIQQNRSTKLPGQPPNDEKLYKTAEVAAIFGVRTTTIREWIADKKIAAITTPGGHFRIRESEVRRVANARFEA